MSEHKIKAVETIRSLNYKAEWDTSTDGLLITCNGEVLRDWMSPYSQGAVREAIGCEPEAPSEEQLRGVIRYYAGK